MVRMVVGEMFRSGGWANVVGYPHNPIRGMPPFDPTSQIGVGGMLEMVGGLAIVLGVLTRPFAFLLAGEMAVAYFQFHAPRSFFPTLNEGVAAVLYCFFFLYLTLAGAGTWSLDAMIARSRSGNPS